MNSGKTEIVNTKIDSGKPKRSRLRKLAYWLFIDISVAVLVFALLLHRPGRYRPTSPGKSRHGQVHPYITHLSSEFYNGTQKGLPFEIVVEQDKINEAVAQADWPRESQGILLYAPAILFENDLVILMGTADIDGIKLIVAVEIQPQVGDAGAPGLGLNVTKVKVGAMNITPLAKMMAKRMYAERTAEVQIDTDALLTKIVASLLTGQAFDPLFTAEDKKSRLTQVTVEQQRLTLNFQPIRR